MLVLLGGAAAPASRELVPSVNVLVGFGHEGMRATPVA